MPSSQHFREESPAGSKPTSVRWLVLVLVALASTTAYLTRHSIAVANTTIEKEMQLTPEQMGWILGAYSLGYFFFQVPTGWLGTKYGTRVTLSSLCVLWSLFTVWSAAAYSFLSLWASRVAFGAAQAGLVPNSAKAVNDWFPVSRRGFGSAAIGAAMSVGGVMTMGLTALLMDRFTWREVFVIFALASIAWAAAYFLLFRTSPEEHPWVNEAERRLIRGVTGKPAGEAAACSSRSPRDNPEVRTHGNQEPGRADAADPPSQTTRELMANMVRSASLWAICFQAAFRAAGYGLFVTWFPAFLEKGYGVTRGSAGLMTMSPLAGVIVGTMLGGVIVDFLLHRTGSRRISRSGMAFSALSLCSFFTLSATWTFSAGWLVAAVSVGALFSGAGNPAAWAATMDIAGRYTAVVMGIMNMAGTLGGITIPVIVGYMIGDIERTGGDWNQVLYLFAGIYLAGALCWLAVDPNRLATEPPRAAH